MQTEIDPNTILIVNDEKTLANCIKQLRNSREISVDTESDSLFVYYEKVCLIQISANDQSYVIDPLETGDLSALNDLFADPDILKIFHAAEYDLMCLKRDFHFEFNSLFDTMVAARMLGRKEVGLGALIEEEFGIHLDKKYQKANWGVRPLTKEMLQYAVSDTRYLSALKDRLQAELRERNMEELAEEDFARLCRIHPGLAEPAAPVWWKASGGTELTPSEMAVLQGLCEFREKAAQQRDIPPFKVISNAALVNIALENPASENALRRIKGVGDNTVKRYGKSILQINKSWRTRKKIPMPPTQQRPSNGILSRRENLKLWRKNTGLKMDVPSDVILPRDILEDIAVSGPRTESELKEIMKDSPVRFEKFGKEILGISSAYSEAAHQNESR